MTTQQPAYAQRIEAILDKQGRRKDWLAERIGIVPSRLSKILHGKRYYHFSPDQRRAVAEALQVPEAILFETTKET